MMYARNGPMPSAQYAQYGHPKHHNAQSIAPQHPPGQPAVGTGQHRSMGMEPDGVVDVKASKGKMSAANPRKRKVNEWPEGGKQHGNPNSPGPTGPVSSSMHVQHPYQIGMVGGMGGPTGHHVQRQYQHPP